jgi:hypothetical protein
MIITYALGGNSFAAGAHPILDFESAPLPAAGLPTHDHSLEPSTAREEKASLQPVYADVQDAQHIRALDLQDDEIEPTEEEYLTLRKCVSISGDSSHIQGFSPHEHGNSRHVLYRAM